MTLEEMKTDHERAKRLLLARYTLNHDHQRQLCEINSRWKKDGLLGDVRIFVDSGYNVCLQMELEIHQRENELDAQRMVEA